VYGHQPDQRLFDPIFPRARLQIFFSSEAKNQPRSATRKGEFAEKIRRHAETYPQLWISLVLQEQHVLIHNIHRTINRGDALSANFFFIGAFFLLTN
jgi:hypothetical protein